MKFLCDRCKTRYSIGDDRVRGKILKIRCKNCANVITVREGMSDAELGVDAAAAPRRKQQVTQAITAQDQVAVAATTAAAQSSTNGRNGGAAKATGALGAAFAAAVTKPPPALEEEWYVSIDGEQSGPFTLAEAQRWVAGKPFDAELHCWSEGFDDWLPVDKVSHFRGLRKKPAPVVAPPPVAAPPPLPRTGSGPARAATMSARQVEARPEETPKPLFAATMASLEKAAAAAAAPAPAPRLNLPSIKNPSATPPNGTPVHTNGKVTAKGSGQSQSQPLPSAKFDVGESATQIEAQAFEDEAKTTAEPVAAAARKLSPAIGSPVAKADRSGGLAPRPHVGAFDDTLDGGMASAHKAPRAPTPDDDLDMDIGEVSRVVKLADLVRPDPKPAQRRSGQMAAVGGSNPMLQRTGSVPKLSQPMLPLGADAPRTSSPQMMAAPPLVAEPLAPAVVASHRRGIIALLIGAAILIGTAIVIVVLVINKETPDVTSLGGEYDLNTQRPDQIVRRPGDPPPETPINPYLPPPVKPPPTKYVKPPVKDNPPVQPPPGNSLKAEEIEAMAAKYGGTTQSCYRRAQRGANGILLADVKKVTVTLSISADGLVANVALSDNMAANDLGKCLVNAMRSWKFRANAGGDFRFVLHFG